MNVVQLQDACTKGKAILVDARELESLRTIVQNTADQLRRNAGYHVESVLMHNRLEELLDCARLAYPDADYTGDVL